MKSTQRGRRDQESLRPPLHCRRKLHIPRSAAAASAYVSCSRMYNDYDGVQHDYTRKQGLVWQQAFLPDMAPAEWADRKILWNAVEEADKTKDSRLAREFVTTFPIELSRDYQP